MTMIRPPVQSLAAPLLALALAAPLAACGDDEGGGSDTADTVLATDGIQLDAPGGGDTRAPCDPVRQTGCAATDQCTYVAAETSPRCFPKGPVPPAGACTTDNRCETGICLAINRTADLCYQFCNEDQDCGTGGTCLTLSAGPFKVCRIPGIYETCGLLAQGCTDTTDLDRACYAVLGEDTPICLPAGTGEPGASCSTASACKEGYACVNSACRALCDTTATSPCGELASCRDFIHGAGFCEPR